MKKRIYQFIFYRLMGWKITGQMDPEILKSVIMIMPHTSWHDFFVGLFARGIIGLDLHWIGKKELFRFPFGAYFRWMGGAPLDRTGGLNKVDSIAAIFKNRKVFRMGISPEGTRKKVTELKTGFYYIALKAGVPIIPIAFDYGKKVLSIAEAYFPTGDFEADMKNIMPHFTGVHGKIPENGFHP